MAKGMGERVLELRGLGEEEEIVAAK